MEELLAEWLAEEQERTGSAAQPAALQDDETLQTPRNEEFVLRVAQAAQPQDGHGQSNSSDAWQQLLAMSIDQLTQVTQALAPLRTMRRWRPDHSGLIDSIFQELDACMAAAQQQQQQQQQQLVAANAVLGGLASDRASSGGSGGAQPAQPAEVVRPSPVSGYSSSWQPAPPAQVAPASADHEAEHVPPLVGPAASVSGAQVDLHAPSSGGALPGASSRASAGHEDLLADPRQAPAGSTTRFTEYMARLRPRREATRRRRQERLEQLNAALEQYTALLGPVEDLAPGDEARTLRCGHAYHRQCVDVWLRRSRLCCLCKRPIDGQGTSD
eukprot:CAMPEP_0179132488 /NCGR_PEP_ID=MMETSP0796-20121207/62972_1 /TAXON_ID=73915 /ORGANISM="Pyrodinium bahamense, Strain pbaha01" /LENGTH=327 /DNA_ID=CAMNT_0020831433 /DNA_START=69 /DNA_END=1052 /DNA_ORIENTATION=-